MGTQLENCQLGRAKVQVLGLRVYCFTVLFFCPEKTLWPRASAARGALAEAPAPLVVRGAPSPWRLAAGSSSRKLLDAGQGLQRAAVEHLPRQHHGEHARRALGSAAARRAAVRTLPQRHSGGARGMRGRSPL